MCFPPSDYVTIPSLIKFYTEVENYQDENANVEYNEEEERLTARSSSTYTKAGMYARVSLPYHLDGAVESESKILTKSELPFPDRFRNRCFAEFSLHTHLSKQKSIP